MKISCIICSYNREKFIGDALNALLKQEDWDYNNLEIILVNNNSTDRTGDICEAFKNENPQLNIVYVNETRQGLSNARNRGIEESTGDICVFLDDDAMASARYFAEVVNFFTSFPDAGAMGGKILPRYEGKPPAWISHYLLPLFSLIDKGDEPRLFSDRHFPIGANMAVRKNLFSTFGNFNPDLGRRGNNLEGGEEKDLFNRMRAGGVKVYYAPQPWVFHMVPVARTTMQFVRKQAYGVGYSERVRTGNKGTMAVTARLAGEAFKWAASIVLFFYYLLTIRPAKGIALVRFRWWVSDGFLRKRLAK